MPVNFKELENLRDRVLKYPAQYRQQFWGYGRGSEVVKEQRPACKTAGCLAYNVVANHGYHLVDFNSNFETETAAKGSERVNICDKAQEILGLDRDQQRELFGANGDRWSYRAYLAHRNAATPKQRAQAAAMAVDDFIAKYRAIEAYGSKLEFAVAKYAVPITENV